jgi:predicted TPR repeat methyltransferase
MATGPTQPPAGDPPVSDERIRVIQQGYDRMAVRFREWASQIEGDPRDRFVEMLSSRLPAGAGVLELGVGGGVESSRRLASRFRLTGVDLSREQLRLAAAQLPDATLVHGDMLLVELPDAAFDAVLSLYVLNHLPRELLPQLFGRIHGWLKPGGAMLVTLGASELPTWQGEWLGVPMHFSGHEADENRRLVGAAGFAIEADELVAIQEPEGAATFHWVLATRG